MNNKYGKAYAEVLEIIKYLPQNEYKKIPTSKIEFYENNKDKEYKFNFDPAKPLEEQNISKEANVVIVTLFRDYFASDNQKEKLKRILIDNEKKYNEELELKYSSNMFVKKEMKNQLKADTINNSQSDSLIKYKGSIFKKFFNFLMSIF